MIVILGKELSLIFNKLIARLRIVHYKSLITINNIKKAYKCKVPITI